MHVLLDTHIQAYTQASNKAISVNLHPYRYTHSEAQTHSQHTIQAHRAKLPTENHILQKWLLHSWTQTWSFNHAETCNTTHIWKCRTVSILESLPMWAGRLRPEAWRMSPQRQPGARVAGPGKPGHHLLLEGKIVTCLLGSWVDGPMWEGALGLIPGSWFLFVTVLSDQQAPAL